MGPLRRVPPFRLFWHHNLHVKRILIIHGWLNHRGEGNWHRWLVAQRRNVGDQVLYPQFPNADNPCHDDWLELLSNELSLLNEIDGGERIVIGHSLGAMTWIQACHRGVIHTPVERVLLVAPAHPDPLRPHLPEWALDLNVEGLANSVAAAAASTRVVGGDVDEWQPAGLHTFSGPIGVPHTVIPGAGHIIVEEGWGPWKGLNDWVDDPTADLSQR